MSVTNEMDLHQELDGQALGLTDNLRLARAMLRCIRRADGQCMRLRWLVAVMLMLMLITTAGSPVPAAAHDIPDDRKGWSFCDWGWASPGSVQVGEYGPPWALPNVEFSVRLSRATSTWNDITRASWTLQHGLRRDHSYNNGHQIMYFYEDVGGALGFTWQKVRWTPGYNVGGCSPHGVVPFGGTLESVHIRVDPRTDWFTRDDSWRTHWERINCSSSTLSGDDRYLCSKNFDIQATMAHEMGHGLGLHHPETIDDWVYLNITSASSDWAGCPTTNASATMCAQLDKKSSNQRTLDHWDSDTMWHHMWVNR